MPVQIVKQGAPYPPWQKPLRGMGLDRSHPLSRGLVGAYIFNEGSGSKVFDSVSRDLKTIAGVSLWDRGGYYTDGTIGNGINVGSTLQITGSFTVWSFVRPGFDRDALNSSHVFRVNYGGNIAGIRWYGYSTDDYRLTVETSAGSKSVTLAENDNFQNEDIKIWCRYDGANIFLGIDEGRIIGSTAQTGTLTATANSFIGCSDLTATTDSWDGHIYATYFWNRALTPAEMAWLHREPYCMFQRSRPYRKRWYKKKLWRVR